MNVLFLSLLDFNTFDERNIYSDLLREFIRNGHKVCCISPVEKRKNQETRMLHFGESCILKLKIGNTQKVNLVEKGISTLRIEPLFIQGVKKYFSDCKFDLVLYATPPVTFAKVIKFIKKRDGAKSYLMLKDIFPQNAVDIGMLTKHGMKSMLYKFFRKKEKKLYYLSDFIGCMSQANIDYLLNHNSDINKDKLHINANSIEIKNTTIDKQKKKEIYEKYSIPMTATTFLYGGNLGKPQDILFIIECLKDNIDKMDRYFVICGNGTEYGKLKAFIDKYNPNNVLLLDGLPRAEYETFVHSFDVGLIFLDHRFTIPNFPSRILSYMQAKMPVLACTDKNTDIGETIQSGKFGWWCESNDVAAFTQKVEEVLDSDLYLLGQNAFSYLSKHFSVESSYQTIINCFITEAKE